MGKMNFNNRVMTVFSEMGTSYDEVKNLRKVQAMKGKTTLPAKSEQTPTSSPDYYYRCYRQHREEQADRLRRSV